MFVRLSSGAVPVIVIVLVAALAVSSLAEKPIKAPREAIEVTRSSYVILQNGVEKGGEEIVHTVYNDNTITFETRQTLTPTPAVTMAQSVNMLVQEESYFPISYHMDKKIEQQDSGMEMSVDVKMFANVAVYTTATPTQSGSRNIVLPTGAAFIETGAVYVYHTLLFWYDDEAGGRQNFEVFDVAGGRPGNVVVQHVAADTVTVAGTQYQADLYRVERDTFSVTLYVDGDGRIVRVDQNQFFFDLAEWSREGAEGE